MVRLRIQGKLLEEPSLNLEVSLEVPNLSNNQELLVVCLGSNNRLHQLVEVFLANKLSRNLEDCLGKLNQQED